MEVASSDAAVPPAAMRRRGTQSIPLDFATSRDLIWPKATILFAFGAGKDHQAASLRARETALGATQVGWHPNDTTPPDCGPGPNRAEMRSEAAGQMEVRVRA